MSRNKLLFAIIDEIRKRNSGLNPEDITTEVEEEIKKFRENKCRACKFVT